ncbi:ArsR/SmtB family transcription factor [Desulfuribacillus alkaliarsenatis]|uniref:Transcriptional regulator n=1 Tax=Desulfuribacillus alkaliarsenatis TaxID=766136 RepID=A0A1E5G0L8_9FIRM|nr:metalloregulator ArsR/SmtB family transcription factor [Desulfuribacillus alkaliarsenatis]OEF96468.1 transcriptional regulator [Desulfuribacillus alkaliarsenatis]
MEQLFKALGDENRLRIINLLRKSELCVCELELILDATQSNISRHLSKLKAEGIINSRKDAQWIHYRINEQFIKEQEFLYKHLNQKMESNKLFSQDTERLHIYKNSSLTCEDIRKNQNINIESIVEGKEKQ